MEITRDTVNQWLTDQRRNQSWLAEKCGVSDQAVSNWLRENNFRPISSSAQITIRSLIEEDAAASQSRALYNMVLEFSNDQYSAIEQAALVRPESVREWTKRTLNDAAGVNIKELAADEETNWLGWYDPADNVPATDPS